MSELREDKMEALDDTQSGRFLTFKLGGEAFGLEIRNVTEIIGMQPVTDVPEVPAYIKGIINLRGRIIPVIDARLKFHKVEVPYNDRTCIIVINIDDVAAGLIVDQVTEVIVIGESDISPPPNSRTGIENRYIKGIGKIREGVTLLLDCDRLLTNDEVSMVAEIM